MCCQKFARHFVLLSTAIFMAFGAVVLAMGIYGMKNGQDLQSGTGYLDNNNLMAVFNIDKLSIGVLVLGIALLFVALTGFIGALKRIKMLLTVYSVILFLVVAVQLTMGGILLAFGATITSRVDDEIRLTWTCWANGETTACDQVNSVVEIKTECPNCIISFEDAYDCCGFSTCKYYTDEVDNTSPIAAECSAVGRDLPFVLFKTYQPNSVYDEWDSSNALFDPPTRNVTCHYSNTNTNTNTFDKGCNKAAQDELMSIARPVLIVALSCGVIEIFSVIFTCILMSRGKDGEDADDPWASPYHY